MGGPPTSAWPPASATPGGCSRDRDHHELLPPGEQLRHDPAHAQEAFEEGGEANGRALAHEHVGAVFGTVYDVSSIMILVMLVSAVRRRQHRSQVGAPAS